MVKVSEVVVVFVICVGFHANAFAQQLSPAWRPKAALATWQFEPDGRPIQVRAKVEGKDCKSLLDTGCTYSVLHQLAAKKISLDDLRMRAIDGIEMEGLPCNWVKSVVIGDISHLPHLLKTRIDGFLGMDVLSRFIIHVDFDNGVVIVIDSKSTETPPGNEVDLGPRISGCPSVPISFGARKPEHFMVDTGSYATIHAAQEIFRDLKADPDAVATGVSDESTDVSAVRHTHEQLRYKATSLGPHQVKNLVISQGKMNVIGMRYLCRYRVTFDFPRNKSYWQPSARFACRDNGDHCGMECSADADGGWFVSSVTKTSPADTAGLKVGDEVLSVNSVPTSQSADNLCLRMLNFPRLSPIYLTVRRGRETLDLTVERGRETLELTINP